MKKYCFTLVELIAAIGIVAILAGITIGGLSFATSRADYVKTQSIVEKFSVALESFKVDYGYYPVQSTGGDLDTSESQWELFMNSNSSSPNKKNRAYWDGAPGVVEDAYGQPLQYQYPNSVSSRNTTKFALWSRGKDKRSGSGASDAAANAGEKNSDDICSWQMN